MKEQIMNIVTESLSEILEELGREETITSDTTIYSGDDGLDSLSLVRLVTAVEMDVNDTFDSDVVLASEKAMSMRNSPYRSVGAFVDFIISEIETES